MQRCCTSGLAGGKVNVAAAVNDVLDVLAAHRNKVLYIGLAATFSVKLFHLHG